MRSRTSGPAGPRTRRPSPTTTPTDATEDVNLVVVGAGRSRRRHRRGLRRHDDSHARERRLERDRRTRHERLVHVPAGWRVLRRRLLYLQGERRGSRLEHGRGLDRRSTASTTPRSRSTTPRPCRGRAATAIDVLANDTDVDGGPKTIPRPRSRPTAPSSIGGAGAHTGLTYTAERQLLQRAPAATPSPTP